MFQEWFSLTITKKSISLASLWSENKIRKDLLLQQIIDLSVADVLSDKISRLVYVLPVFDINPIYIWNSGKMFI